MSRRREKMKALAAANKPAAPTITARYDAATNGRAMRAWAAPSSGPNTATAGLATIRNRMRDIERNEWAGRSSTRSLVSNIIGTGIVPRFATKNAAAKKRLTDLWKAWVPVADADGVLNFYGLQALVARTFCIGGEAFVRLRPRRLSDGLPVPLQIQVLEGDFVPLLNADSYINLPPGNVIRSGIEFDRIGRRVAYWMYRNHPGDRPLLSDPNPQELTRVPAEFVCPVFDPSRPGQLRGVSDMSTVVAKLKGIGDFDAAVLTRQQIANLFALFITQQAPNPADPIMGTGAGTLALPGDASAVALEPGIAHTLLPGESVEFSEPPDAGANYAEFMRQQHLGVSAGGGVPYEFTTGDAKDISDRTLRILVQEFRRVCEQRQWLIFIPMLCERVLGAWARAAELAGVVDSSTAAEIPSARWSPQGWAYIHPTQDVQAKALEVTNGFRSKSSVVGERGDDPDDVAQERADDIARDKQHGLEPTAAPAPPQGQPQKSKA